MRASRVRALLPESSQRRILSYIAGASALLASAGTAEAGVVYNAHNVLVRSDTQDLFTLDLDGDGNDDLDFVTCACSAAGGYALTNFLYAYVTTGPLVHPTLIGPGGSWTPYSYFLYSTYNINYDPDTGYTIEYTEDYGPWTGLNGVPNYLGVEFERFDSNGDIQTHYGWVRMRVGVDKDFGAFIHVLSSAWETQADTPISTAAVPEPGSLGLLAGGILGLAAWRKRKAVREQ